MKSRYWIYVLLVSIASLFTFGHIKTYFGWTSGYIAYSLIYLWIGHFYDPTRISPKIYYLIVIPFFLFNFYNLYVGSSYVYYPIPALVLASGAIGGFIAGILLRKSRYIQSIALYTPVIILLLIFCHWLPHYYYNYRTNLSTYDASIHQKVDLDFVDIQGKHIDKKIWENKIVLVDFWFLECGWCHVKMPLLGQIRTHYKSNENVQILSVIDGSVDSKEDVINYLKKNRPDVPIYYDLNGKFLKKYKLNKEGYPVEIKIDRNGVIQEVLFGLWSFEEVYVEESIKHITNLL